MTMADPVVHALIPAAGRGQRFGDALLKQYANIAGWPVLAHTLAAVDLKPEISGITVVLAEDDDQFEEMIAPGFPGVTTATGGETRAESVLNGLRAIRENHPEADWVLVHDAARPCLPQSCIRRLLRQGLAHPDGAILAVPVRDTLKRENGGAHIDRTVDRSGLWAAQTPQLFPLPRLLQALEAMLAAGEPPTDESSAMEWSGAHPLLVMGSSANVKITYPDDVVLVESVLSAKLMD
jgi:2-C-methyl-D-erythritol 4-phosphate cytidylyltransferase